MRILKLLCLATTAAALGTSPVLAQVTDSDTINLSGTQAQTCTLGAFSAGVPTGDFAFTAPAAVSLTGTMSSSTAMRAAGSISLDAAAMCNYKHFVSVRQTSGGLIKALDVVPAQGTFVRQQGYDATVTWAGKTVTASSSDVTSAPTVAPITSTSSEIAGAASGTLSLTLSVAASTSPVVAGAYTDSVVVQIGAGL